MRRLALVLLLAACGASSSTGPAWPKTADKETDGGESLEPRGPSAIAAKSDDDDDDEVEAKPAEKPAEKAADDKAETPKPATETPRASEEIIITTEEIVIEIDED